MLGIVLYESNGSPRCKQTQAQPPKRNETSLGPSHARVDEDSTFDGTSFSGRVHARIAGNSARSETSFLGLDGMRAARPGVLQLNVEGCRPIIIIYMPLFSLSFATLCFHQIKASAF